LYDRPLTIDQVLTQLKEQPEAIAELVAGLPRARLHRPPSHGEWAVNDVLAHLRSCSDMWGKYIATIIAEDRPTIRAMNPTTWIKSTNYPELEFAPSLRAFAKQRAELLALLRPLAKGSLVAYRDGYGRRKATRTDCAGVRAVARQPRAIPHQAHRAHRQWMTMHRQARASHNRWWSPYLPC